MKSKNKHWSLDHKKFPLTAAAHAQYRKVAHSGGSFSGFSPSVFVGRFGYPKVNVGVLAAPHKDDFESYGAWKKNALSIDQIIAKRTALMQARKVQGIKDQNNYIDQVQDISMSTKQVDANIDAKKLSVGATFSQFSAPCGPMRSYNRYVLTTLRLPLRYNNL